MIWIAATFTVMAAAQSGGSPGSDLPVADRAAVLASPSDGDRAWKQRRLTRRETDEQAARAIKDHLPGVSQLELHHNLQDGVSLSDCIIAEKRRCKKLGKRIGPLWWQAVKRKYGISSCASSLVVNDPNEEVQPELKRALAAASTGNPSKRSSALLEGFFASGRRMNQKELVGVARWMIDKRVGTNKKARNLFVAFADSIGKQNMHDAAEVEFLKDLGFCQLALPCCPSPPAQVSLTSLNVMPLP